jgi:putative acetyltransferase
MQIRPDDLTSPQVLALLEAHLRDMRRETPPESMHALDLSGLRGPGVSFWTAWSGPELLGCGALKELDPGHGELKSMRTAEAHRHEGVARAMLAHILAVARARGYRRLSLETGAQPGFEPARRLYAAAGFRPCPPFASYRPDPLSVFFTLTLP